MNDGDWFRRWKNVRGFPDDYVVIDLETTGLSPDKDFIIQIGHCLIEDRVPVDNKAYVLDWSKTAAVNQALLRKTLEDVKRAIEYGPDGRRTGGTYEFTYDRMTAEGLAPTYVLRNYYEMITGTRAGRLPLVGHNSWAFDHEFLVSHFDKWLGLSFRLSGNDMIDTGMMEKASQLTDPRADPVPGEDSETFSRRVRGIVAKGVRWNLSTHVIQKYGFAGRHGLDQSRCHDAAYDALVTHYLLEEFRALAGAAGKEINV